MAPWAYQVTSTPLKGVLPSFFHSHYLKPLRNYKPVPKSASSAGTKFTNCNYFFHSSLSSGRHRPWSTWETFSPHHLRVRKVMDRFLSPHKRQRVNDDDQEPYTSHSTENPELEENVDDDSTQKNTRRPPGPNDISLLPDSGPTCPDLKKYPSHMQGGQTRSFNKRWYQQYSWLEYSAVKDAAYCFACRHFITSNLGRAEQSFTHNGFKNWKKATMSLKAHDTSACHKFAMQAWGEFKLQKVTGATIYQAIDAGHDKTVAENRRYIRAVIDVLLYTACQNVAQGGHKEGVESDNRGNFLELLNVLAKYDHTVAKKLTVRGMQNILTTIYRMNYLK
ncbi:uncharacterized protein LOC143030881 [Oratosquilla oratoria]|uniref:uncharacterized protein LOC143030881 n=1 Tax=Oratosquilla oratoria TaxID=337810 RepID=UPI003F75BD6D